MRRPVSEPLSPILRSEADQFAIGSEACTRDLVQYGCDPKTTGALRQTSPFEPASPLRVGLDADGARSRRLRSLGGRPIGPGSLELNRAIGPGVLRFGKSAVANRWA